MKVKYVKYSIEHDGSTYHVIFTKKTKLNAHVSKLVTAGVHDPGFELNIEVERGSSVSASTAMRCVRSFIEQEKSDKA